MPRLHNILVANRAEIACRVIRSVQALGYRAIAVYSEADRRAPHVALADAAICIGAAPPAESYLNIDRLLQACRRTGADALHPGYGFVSENPALGEACDAAGICFIGPSARAMRLMGDKALAKQHMLEAGVPTALAYLGNDQSPQRLMQEAERIGFPLLIKATAGGGGRGIRVVRAAHELQDAIDSAQREAHSAFGSDKLLLERFIEHGRHVEVQVVADTHGHAIYLGDRDCTAQRRRQKLIEEAPAPGLSAQLRAQMGQSAVRAALSIGYTGAGTVEFMLDREHAYHFLEMNTRLQVEHPVTELVTGLDLVALQIKIAEGEALPLTQAQVQLDGHAIEARLYAEDPYDGFKPQSGRVSDFFVAPALAQPGIRIDSGVRAGSDVSTHYDAMLAKVMARGATRTEAIRKLRRALEDAPLFGLTTNARFLLELLRTDEFERATHTTSSLDLWCEQRTALFIRPDVPDEAWALACALALEGRGDGFRSAGEATFNLTLACRQQQRTLYVTQRRCRPDQTDPDGPPRQAEQAGQAEIDVRVNDAVIELRAMTRDPDAPYVLSMLVDGVRKRRVALWQTGKALIAIDGQCLELSEPAALDPKRTTNDPSRVHAPLSGRIVRVLAQPGSRVDTGQNVCIIEAMKMETRVVAAGRGTVRELLVNAGDQVSAGELLLCLTLSEESS